MRKVIDEYVRVSGGLTPSIVGKRFAGKKDGTWREVTSVSASKICWRNERGATGKCWWATLIGWCRNPAFVLDDDVGNDVK